MRISGVITGAAQPGSIRVGHPGVTGGALACRDGVHGARAFNLLGSPVPVRITWPEATPTDPDVPAGQAVNGRWEPDVSSV